MTSPKTLRLSRSHQDAEVFLFGARDRRGLLDQLHRLVPIARQLARAELADLAATLARESRCAGEVRAAVVASSPDQLSERLEELLAWIDESRAAGFNPRGRPRRLKPAARFCSSVLQLVPCGREGGE